MTHESKFLRRFFAPDEFRLVFLFSMPLRSNQIRPHQTFNFIVASIALALIAEGALLWKLSQKSGSPAPETRINPAALPTPTSASFFVAPGVSPQTKAPTSPLSSIFSAPAAPNRGAVTPKFEKKGAAPLAGNSALAKSYFEAATAALSKKDNKTALENFRRVAQIAPDNLPTRLNLALLYLDANQPAQAIPHLQKAAQLDPKSAAARFQLAQAYLSLKKPNLAIAPLEEVVKLVPDERAARALLAQVYAAQKRPRQAYAQWESLAKSQPRDVDAHLQAATLAADSLKRPADAEKWLQRAQKAVPKDPRPALLLGRLFLAQNKPKRAAQALTAAAQSNPGVFEIYPALADARLAAGDLSGARGALQSALSRMPAAKNEAQKVQVAQIEGGLHLALGRVWGQSKKPKQAQQEFERAAALLPRNPEPRSLLALAALQNGDKKTAVAALQSALLLDSKRATDRLTLAQIFAQNQNWRAADEQYAAYTKLQPRDRLALTQWAQVSARRGRSEQSLKIWSQIAALDPKNPLPHLQRGAMLRDLKRSGPALDAFESALQVSPNDAGALFEVARLQSALKKPEATLTWRKLIAASPDYLPAYGALLKASAQSGDETSTRLFLARQLSRGKENLRALSEILRFYGTKNGSAQAKALLADIVQRNPRAKTARAALDSFGTSAAPRPLKIESSQTDKISPSSKTATAP